MYAFLYGSGNEFRAILDGRASHDGSGKITSYYWSENPGDNSTAVISDLALLTNLFLPAGTHQFNLEVRDDQGQVDEAKVTINIIQNFYSEYDGLTWDSTTGSLETISVRLKKGLIASWPDFSSVDIANQVVFINDFNGKCNDIGNWKKLDFVPYDSIQLTSKPIFYSLVPSIPNNINQKTMYQEVYARTNSGIDFSQKVSLGLNVASSWEY